MPYALLLNDMRSPNVENIQVVRTSGAPKELADWCTSQLAPEPWHDGQWGKAFAKDSDLEWYNAPKNLTTLNDYWGGIWEVPEGTGVGTALTKH